MARTSHAADLDEMGRLLAPVYTAMNLAGVCGSEPLWRNSQPRGRRGTALHYAEHVKNEMIAGPSHEAALVVLRAAADRAREASRQQLRVHVYAQDQATEASRFSQWCAHTVRDYISAFMQGHERDHDAFLENLNHVKRLNGTDQRA